MNQPQWTPDSWKKFPIVQQPEWPQEEFNEVIADVEDKKTYKMNVRMNVSISYKLWDSIEAILYVHSIPLVNNNHRYSYDSGNSKLSPNKIGIVEEPTFIGAKMLWTF